MTARRPPRYGPPSPREGINETGISTTGPRVLLRHLRGVMAQPVEAQSRLNQIVDLIASNMVAEVCSIYIGGPGENYELFATTGLDPEAVHKTSLQIGEGLVGEIARTAEPLNLTDAPSHPKFAYRPETREDPYHSFLGVPIMKSGHVVGVLVVQNQTLRHYDEEEVEALQTVAMVLAEIAATGELIPIDDTLIEEEVRPRHPFEQTGVSFADGLGIGHAFLHAAPIIVTQFIAESVAFEGARLNEAVETLQVTIANMLSEAEAALPREPREVLETYQMFAHDRGWIKRMQEAVRNGLTAEAAVEQVQNDTRLRMSRQTDAYLRDRLHDLDDLSNRLLRILVGDEGETRTVPDDAIVFARNIGPADLLEYDQTKLRGLVLEDGSTFSHVAIVARALGIPLIGQTHNIIEHVRDGDLVIADGEQGSVYIRPTKDIVQAYETKFAVLAEEAATFESLRHEKAVTQDGVRIALNMNAGLLVDLPNLERTGSDGIGLFRTELQFMVSSTMPRLNAQIEFYSRVLEASGDKPVIFRSIDIGGDKILPYGFSIREENPALGLRAIRFALSRPALLRYQLRAFLMAAGDRPLNVIFPMITTVDEFRQAKELLDIEIDRLNKLKVPISQKIRVGSMIEVPGLIFQLDELLPLVDFVSIGSNDLFQFLFAVDRSNPEVGSRYDFLNLSTLRAMRAIVDKCEESNVDVSLCGEVSGNFLEAMALIGIGLRSLSMPASRIGRIKAMVRKLNWTDLREYMDDLLSSDGSKRGKDQSLRTYLEQYSQERGLRTRLI